MKEKRLHLPAEIGYADAKFTSHVPGTVPVPGDRLRHTPKWTANVALGAKAPGLERYAANRPRTIGLNVKGAF